MIIARAVITTGRSRVTPAVRAALGNRVRLGVSLANVIIRMLLEVASDAHDRPHQGRHTDRCLRDVEHPQKCRPAHREGRENDERVEPRLKVHHISR